MYIIYIFLPHFATCHHSVSELEVENEKLRSDYDQLRTSIKHGVEINELNGKIPSSGYYLQLIYLYHFLPFSLFPFRFLSLSTTCRTTGGGP